jgi:2-polyprenyl-3-methyl-5-hydroxy-6-metoxy-1,4-benzoquinol methylase
MRTDGGTSIYEDEASLFMTADQADYYRDNSTEEAAQRKLAWVQQNAPRGARLLDVGASFGYFVKAASTWFDAVGIEPSPPVVRWAAANLRVPVERGSIEEDRPEFHGRFDVITMFDVIEHLGDPRAALRRCREYSSPQGRLFITTPDTGSFMARLLRSHWYYNDLVEHVSLFDAANLTRLLADTGFVVRSRRTIGRSYRLSYIERRLGQLAHDAVVLRALHLASRPLRLLPAASVTLNLGDVMGLEAAVA